MSSNDGKPLRHWTKAELDEALATNASHISYSVQEIAAEADRRDQVKAERRLSRSWRSSDRTSPTPKLDKMTDEQLKNKIKMSATNTTRYNDLRQELERRRAVAQARATRNVGIVTFLIALVAVVVAVLND
jgi:hypothetical protein